MSAGGPDPLEPCRMLPTHSSREGTVPVPRAVLAAFAKQASGSHALDEPIHSARDVPSLINVAAMARGYW